MLQVSAKTKSLNAEHGELRMTRLLDHCQVYQMVTQPICTPDEIMEEELLQYCQENHVSHVERLLQKAQHPSGRALFAQNGYRPRSGPSVIPRVAPDNGSLQDGSPLPTSGFSDAFRVHEIVFSGFLRLCIWPS